MLRSFAALLAAGVVVSLCGCFSLSQGGSPAAAGKPVETPTLSPASADAADRVSVVGADLVAATPMGIPEVDFLTLGSAESELFHQATSVVYVSEGLAAKCKTDEQLAAVLAVEVGRLTAEYRRAQRKASADPIPAAAEVQTPGGGIDPSRDAYLAQFEKEGLTPARKRDWPTVDANEIAADLLRNSGHDPKLLAEVMPLVREAGHGKASKQLTPTAAPKWSW